MILIYAFIIGIAYTFSEIEYIWSKGTWSHDIFGNKRLFELRSWVTDWMKGNVEIDREYFSFFEDGYHFFGNLPIVLLGIYIFLVGILNCVITIEIYEAVLFFPVRWLGRKIGWKLICKWI